MRSVTIYRIFLAAAINFTSIRISCFKADLNENRRAAALDAFHFHHRPYHFGLGGRVGMQHWYDNNGQQNKRRFFHINSLSVRLESLVSPGDETGADYFWCTARDLNPQPID